MRNFKLLSLATVLLLVLGACSSQSIEQIETDFANAQDTTAALPCGLDTITVSFATDIVPIMTMYCADNSFNANGSCHGAGAFTGDFATYAIVSGYAENAVFMNRIRSSSNPMPPAYSSGPQVLDPCEIEYIEDWIREGRQDN